MTTRADQMQTDIHRSMTGAKRLELALDMSMYVRQLAISRLRTAHPSWSEEALIAELLRLAMLRDTSGDRDD